tara:strand:+ start:3958 stop:5601 length:1644 start_codon:yes stop_codon:yes gene_type:complete
VKRRQVLTGVASLPILYTTELAADTAPSFLHGVASGDPDQESVVIWTRVSGLTKSHSVSWQIGLDSKFQQIVSHGGETTNQYQDYTVKAVVDGLEPGKNYFYRFSCRGVISPIGRTRTLPKGDIDSLGLAIASCSNYAFGFFNGYDAIARDDAVDFVLHLGDYIYEYAATGWGAQTALALNRAHTPINEIVSLQDYRVRHAQYKADPDSQRMHAAKPLLLVWDDHESANNPWVGGAQNHQPSEEGRWTDRRDSAIRAYYEWMPIREPNKGADRKAFWRSYQFGSLATLINLESRHTGRGEQIDYADHVHQITSKANALAFQRDILEAPGRTMLSTDMESFLSDELERSKREGTAWRLIGNAIPMARIPVPNLEETGISMPEKPGVVPGVSADLVWKGKWGLPLYLDTWDGYPLAREQLYSLCAACGVSDLLVLTGDSHSFWANKLTSVGGQNFGIEIGTAGITSPGDFIEQGFDPSTAGQIDEAFATQIPDVRWTSNLYQGYVRLLLTQARVTTDYIAVSTVNDRHYHTSTIRQERIIRDDQSLKFV